MTFTGSTQISVTCQDNMAQSGINRPPTDHTLQAHCTRCRFDVIELQNIPGILISFETYKRHSACFTDLVQ